MKFIFFNWKIQVFYEFIIDTTTKAHKITWNYNLSVVLFTTFCIQSTKVGIILGHYTREKCLFSNISDLSKGDYTPSCHYT